MERFGNVIRDFGTEGELEVWLGYDPHLLLC